jgi:hypothetical protein
VKRVFDNMPPFSRLVNIGVGLQDLNNAQDIVVCRDTSQLYIADWEQSAIWRVNLMSDKQVDKKIISTLTPAQRQPWSLSMKSHRLLITPRDSNVLSIYGDDGVLLKHIKLPDYMRATLAVKTTHNTFIVRHCYRQLD